MIMKTFYTFTLLILLSVGMLHAQNEVVVNVGDDIITKIQEVEEGGTLLIMPGAHKASYDNIEVTKSMTIKNNGGVNDTRVHIKQIDVPANGISLTIEGIIWSGAALDSISGEVTVAEGQNLAGDYFINLITGETMEFGDIVVNDCIIRHLNRAAVRGDRDAYFAKKIAFDNCIFEDFRGGGDYGPFRMKSRITFDEFSVTNSTFFNVKNKIIDLQDMEAYPCEITLDHCTFYAWGGGKSGQYLFDIKYNTEASFIVTNCILGKTNVSEDVTINGWRVDDGEGNSIKYNEFQFSVMSEDFIIESGNFEETDFDQDNYNFIMEVPFVDPENGNFEIPDESNINYMSADGTIVGDPRWADGPVSVADLKEASFKVYPSIADNVIYIENGLKEATNYTIYSMTGKKVLSAQNITDNKSVNISSLQRGVYFVKPANKAEAFRFIKK
jgi:hypothetical protein